MSTHTTSKNSAADTVEQWLLAHPGWHTLKDIDTDLDGVITRATISKRLKQLWQDDKIRRHVGDTDLARGKTQPDKWSALQAPTTTDTGSTTKNTTTTDTKPATAPAVATTAVKTDTGSTAKKKESTTPPPASTPDEPTAQMDNNDTSTDTSSSGSVPPVVPDTRVIAVAGVLSEHHDTGLTAADVATCAGLALGVAWRVLLAMQLAGAATCDADFVLSGTGRWRPGPARPADVTVDHAPATVSCPTCGTDARIPGRKTARRRSIDGLCFDGAPPLAPGALAQQVRDYVTTHPGEAFTPGQVAKALGARSSGAVLNVLVKLTATTDLVTEDHNAPHRTFRATDTQ